MDNMKEAYTTAELVNLFDSNKMTVNRRASRENWQSRPRAGRGGGREWLVSSMPEKTRLALAAKLAPVVESTPFTPKSVSLPVEATLSSKAQCRADAKAMVLHLCVVFTKFTNLPKTRGMEAFAVRWNAGEIEAEDWLKKAVPHVTKNTLVNWTKTVTAEGSLRLAGDYGKGQRGKGCIDSQPEVKEIIVAMMNEKAEASSTVILDFLRAANAKRLPENRFDVPSLRVLQRWMQRWKERNPSLYQFTQSPDMWRNRYLPSFGDYYAGIVHLNQLWEYDGTPSDIMLSDGKRYAIIGVIEIYTRRVKLRVTPSSTAREVAEITRSCLLDWGVPEVAATDNGKEYVSRQMIRLFTDLDIRHDPLPPFRPDRKPAIERVFHSFSHDLLPAAPCYLGHDVATRKKIESRKSFAERLMKRGGEPEELSMAMTPEALQKFCDNWTDKIYMHRPHDGLSGKTPYEKLAECKDTVRRIPDDYLPALDMLLLPVVGERRINKESIRMGGREYIAPELGNADIMGRMAEIRMDRQDTSAVYVYMDGLFICRAECVDNMSAERRQELAVAGRIAARSVKKQAAAIRRLAKKHGINAAAQDIMDYHLARAEEIEAASPQPVRESEEHVTFELEEARRAVSGEKNMQTLTPEEAEAAQRQAVELTRPVFTVPGSTQERYALFQELNARAEAGKTLSSEEETWLSMYRLSAECKGFEDMRFLYAVNE